MPGLDRKGPISRMRDGPWMDGFYPMAAIGTPTIIASDIFANF